MTSAGTGPIAAAREAKYPDRPLRSKAWYSSTGSGAK